MASTTIHPSTQYNPYSIQVSLRFHWAVSRETCKGRANVMNYSSCCCICFQGWKCLPPHHPPWTAPPPTPPPALRGGLGSLPGGVIQTLIPEALVNMSLEVRGCSTCPLPSPGCTGRCSRESPEHQAYSSHPHYTVDPPPLLTSLPSSFSVR